MTWTSGTPAVATARDYNSAGVPLGAVTGVAPGSATITATSDDGQGTATLAVTQVTFVAVSAGGFTTCGLSTGGAAFCWGNGDYGALGAPTATDFTQCFLYSVANVPCSPSPVGVRGGLIFASVDAGWEGEEGGGSVCGLTLGGASYCWGNNSFGELGNDTISGLFSITPTPVVGGLTFTALGVGGYHTCGLTPVGTAFCWGDNSVGQCDLTQGPFVSIAASAPLRLE